MPRSSPKTLTAMLARVPDSMWSIRCEIGCPIVTFVPGSVENCRRSSASSSCARAAGLAQADVDLGGLDALHVLVVLGAAGPARGRDHLRLRQQDLLDAPADLVGLRQRGAGQRIRLHGQAAFVELGQEGGAHAGQRRSRGDQQRRPRDGDHRTRDGRAPAAASRANRALSVRASQPSWPRWIDGALRQEGERRAPASRRSRRPATRAARRCRRTPAASAAGLRRRSGRRSAGTPAR